MMLRPNPIRQHPNLAHLDLDDVANRTLPRILELQAQHRGDTVFLMQDERRVTFAEADARVKALARGLRSLGLRSGERVAFYARSSIEGVLFALAANRLGAAWVPINTDYRGEWLRDTLVSSDAALLLVDAELLPRLAELAEKVPGTRTLLIDGECPDWAQPLAPLFEVAGEDVTVDGIGYGHVCAVLWTSGTTGKSKGVMQSHNVWISNAEDGQYCYDSRPGDVIYCVLPMYNSAAWATSILRALVHGIACALDTSFSVSRFWERVRYYGATQSFTLGAMHIFLWQQPADARDRDNSLRSVGMVPMPQELIEPFRERFGIERIYQGFGQSEALSVMRRVDGPRSWKPGALGEPCYGMTVALLDDEGREVPRGQVGEFAIRPAEPHLIFEGYFRNPEADAEVFTDGWYRMGDLGRQDEDGDFYFVDRKKDAVRYKGRNISTMEVESVLRRHPDVAEVAAFGVPCAELSSEHELKCDIVLRPGSTVSEAEIAGFVNDNAPHFFVPRYIEFVAALPYTPTNKVQKYLLRQAGVGPRTWDRAKTTFRIRK